MVLFTRTYQSLSKIDIDSVEQLLGIRVPDDLREHYLHYNGGRPDPRFFEKEGDWYGVQDFLPMRTKNKDIGFEETYRDLVLETPNFPSGLVPFAVDESGDYFLYCVTGNEAGKIFFNQSEFTGDPDRFLVCLSDSLESFITGLSNPE